MTDKVFSYPRGTMDILPSDIHCWQKIEEISRNIFKSFNYKEIRTPIFEETDLFVRSMGKTSEVVQKQMLNLASQKTDDNIGVQLSGLTLRPENTASVVRSYIQNNIDKKESLTKLFYIGPMFRGERPQKGRLRQFHQIGVEVIGANSSSPYLDAEVISLGTKILHSLGLNNFKLKINTLGTLEDKENFAKILHAALQSEVESLCDDCKQRISRNVFRILDCKNKNCKDIIGRLNLGHSYLSEESAKYFDQVKKCLDILNVQFEEDFNLVRGLDYYTHTVFEISDSSLGSQDALGAGGRYNNLVPQLGGPEVDAIGFALGVERMLLAMNQAVVIPPEYLSVYLIFLDDKGQEIAFKLADNFRENGIVCDLNYKISSIKSQMRFANKLNAKAVIIIGENEVKSEKVSLKDMTAGSQEEVSIKDGSYEELIKILLERYK